MNTGMIIGCLAAVAISGTAHAGDIAAGAAAESALAAQLEAAAADARDAFSADILQIAADRTQERGAFEEVEDNRNSSAQPQIASLR